MVIALFPFVRRSEQGILVITKRKWSHLSRLPLLDLAFICVCDRWIHMDDCLVSSTWTVPVLLVTLTCHLPFRDVCLTATTYQQPDSSWWIRNVNQLGCTRDGAGGKGTKKIVKSAGVEVYASAFARNTKAQSSYIGYDHWK